MKFVIGIYLALGFIFTLASSPASPALWIITILAWPFFFLSQIFDIPWWVPAIVLGVGIIGNTIIEDGR
jgi:hypothetical protein